MDNGQSIAYTVTCGTMVMKEDNEKDGNLEADKPRASIFFMARKVAGMMRLARSCHFDLTVLMAFTYSGTKP